MPDHLVEVHVKAPASIANLGAGFDCLALAVDLWNDYYVYTDLRNRKNLRRHEWHIKLDKNLEPDYSEDEDGNTTVFGRMDEDQKYNKFIETCERIYRRLYSLAYPSEPRQYYQFFLRETVRIPPKRGLGSSSSACVAGVLAGIQIFECAHPEKKVRELLKSLRKDLNDWNQFYEVIATQARRADDSPDNVCASLHGGLTVAFEKEPADQATIDLLPPLHYFQYPVSDPGLKVVCLIPKHEMDTGGARNKLKDWSFSTEDLVFNLARSTCFSSALIQKRYDLLPELTKDRCVQKKRMDNYFKDKTPDHERTFSVDGVLKSVVVEEVGAYCAFVSGSGSTLAALVDQQKCKEVSRVFEETYKEVTAHIKGWDMERIIVLDISNKGASWEVNRVERFTDPDAMKWFEGLPVLPAHPNVAVSEPVSEEDISGEETVGAMFD